MKGAYRIPVGKSEENKKFARSNSTWEDNIKMNLKDVVAVNGLD
jgi:hypothetical protein